MRLFIPLFFTLAMACPIMSAELAYKAGTAATVITPTEPLWMAGYGNRDKPCDTKQHELWVKVLAIEDSAGHVGILLTSDLCGIPRGLAEDVTSEVMKKTGLKREQIALTCSHTHCGPVVKENLLDMYPMTDKQKEDVGTYTKKLRGWMIDTILKAYENRKPATLSIGKGTARFAINRRQQTDKGVSIGTNPMGPVDHDVPVLRVEDEKGKLLSVVFGYACHNTTMAFYEWCGDYAGFAQIEIEKKHPGTLAMFWIGCGGDANPNPRRELEHCMKHGKELAGAVEDVLKEKMSPLSAKLSTKYKEITLNLDTIPGKEKWEMDSLSKTIAVKNRATRMLKYLENGGKIPDHYDHYPVQIWKFGDKLTWAMLGGEVVIDYNLRLKKELKDHKNLWITAYSNDVLAYIPSKHVLQEGGYEADSSQIYYGLPTKWAPSIEDKIIGTVVELSK